jgi:hypothetical protein
MFFLEAAQAPVVTEIDIYKLSIPLMTLADWTVFGAERDAARRNELTAGMSNADRFHFLNYYSVIPTSLADLMVMRRSPVGVEFIIRNCVGKATLLQKKNKATQEFEDVSPLNLEDEKAVEARVKLLNKLARMLIKFADHDDLANLTNQLSATRNERDNIRLQQEEADRKAAEQEERRKRGMAPDDETLSDEMGEDLDPLVKQSTDALVT